MDIQLLLLGVLFLLSCIMDYTEFKDEIRDQQQEEEEEEDK